MVRAIGGGPARGRQRAASVARRIASCALVAVVWGAPAHPGCLPLPSPEFRRLDGLADDQPQQAIEQAQAVLASPAGKSDPLVAAQMDAILAVAHINVSHPDESKAAVRAALEALDRLPPSAEATRLRQRVLISDADSAAAIGDGEAGVRMLDTVLAAMPADSLERSCALATRAQARGDLNQTDTAAADGIEAYRIAEAGGWAEARMEAAYGLASVYRRAGLYERSESMINEVIAFAKAHNRSTLLAMAEFINGYILADEHKFRDATEALQIVRTNSEQMHDPVGVAAADLEICDLLIQEGSLADAKRMCAMDESPFRKAQRTDLIALLHGFRARIALEQGQPREARNLLQELLDTSASEVPPYYLPDFYRYRATAHFQLGEFKPAYLDSRTALDLDRKTSVAQRLRAVAVLSATADTERLIANNRGLQTRLDAQRQELSTQKLVRILWTTLSLIALMVASLLGYLLLVTRRQGRALRRQETILRTLASHAPDALVLLDEQRLVRFANRNLFGDGPVHPAGQTLTAGVSAAARSALGAAIEEIYARRESVSFTLNVVDHAGEMRYFDVRGGPAVESGQLVGATIRSVDATGIRRLEREVIDVSSRERQRMSFELHEGLGQELTGVLLTLRGMSTWVERGQAVSRQALEDVIAHVAGGIEKTREIARGLAPVKIERGSLRDALTRLGSDLERRHGIDVFLDWEPEEIAISDLAADHLYRIVSEAVTNAVRRGSCTEIRIELSVAGDRLSIAVADDGADSSYDREADSLSLRLMAYRARLMGGSVDFRGLPGGGNQLDLSIPVSAGSGAGD